MGGIEVTTVEYPHSIIVADWQSLEELYEALLVIDLFTLVCRTGERELTEEVE